MGPQLGVAIFVVGFAILAGMPLCSWFAAKYILNVGRFAAIWPGLAAIAATIAVAVLLHKWGASSFHGLAWVVIFVVAHGTLQWAALSGLGSLRQRAKATAALMAIPWLMILAGLAFAGQLIGPHRSFW